MSNDVVVIPASAFDEANRCPELIKGHRCLHQKGHRGKHNPSKYVWKADAVSPPKPRTLLPLTGWENSMHLPAGENVPALLVKVANATKHENLLVQATHMGDHVQVVVTEVGTSKLQRELEQTKAVLGDLLQDRGAAGKVFIVVQFFGGGESSRSEVLRPFATLDGAKQFVEGRTGGRHAPWAEHNGHDHCWTVNIGGLGGRDGYMIEEHEVSA